MPDPLYFDSHMHTPLCKHAEGKPVEYARVGKKRGLKGIIMTCHSPMPDRFSHHVRMDPAEFDEYVEMVQVAADEMADEGFVVRLGLESDFFPGMEDWLEALHRRADFHYILGSVHPFIAEYREAFSGSGEDVAFQAGYFAHLADAAETGLFDCLSHPDIVKVMFPRDWDFGPAVVEAIHSTNDIFLDVHLMITNPDRYVPEFVKAGADLISVHVEADHDVAATLGEIRKAGRKCGLAFNPATPLSEVEPYLDQVDLLLAMTLVPAPPPSPGPRPRDEPGLRKQFTSSNHREPTQSEAGSNIRSPLRNRFVAPARSPSQGWGHGILALLVMQHFRHKQKAFPRPGRFLSATVAVVGAVAWLAIRVPLQAASSVSVTLESAVVDGDLTAQANRDWAIWGTGFAGNLAPDERKAGTPRLISDLSAINPAGEALRGVGSDTSGPKFSWSDGAGFPSASDVYAGIRNENLAGRANTGFSFTIPAVLRPRRLKVHVSATAGTGRLTARLSDGTVASGNFQAEFRTTGTFDVLVSPGSAGQTLSIDWVMLDGASGSHVTLYAVAVSDPPALIVDTLEDQNDTPAGPQLSLREAIRDAPPGAVILFDPDLAGQTINYAAPSINKQITLDASLLDGGITLSGKGVRHVIDIAVSGVVTLDGLTITGGKTRDALVNVFGAGDGGGIHNSGFLILRNCTVHGNTTGAGDIPDWDAGNGGGIYNSGLLIVQNSVIRDNFTGPGGAGDSGGHGAGIYNIGTLVVRRSTISGNATGVGSGYSGAGSGRGGDGGGIYNRGRLDVTDSTISGNTTGAGGAPTGAGFSGGNGGDGGGIFNYQDSLAFLANSTVAGNTTGAGGRGGPSALPPGGTGGDGGRGAGIFANRHIEINGSTISANRTGSGGRGTNRGLPGKSGAGGGLFVQGGNSAVVIFDTVIASNIGAAAPDIMQPDPKDLFSAGGNLIGKNTLSGQVVGSPNAKGDYVGTPDAPLDPLLGPLADNGGSTLTMLPQPGSPLLDTGRLGLQPFSDQRGQRRIIGAAPDIGAVERQLVEPGALRIVEWKQTGQIGQARFFTLKWTSYPGEIYRIERSTDGRGWSLFPKFDNLPAQGFQTQRILDIDAAAYPRIFVRVARK